MFQVWPDEAGLSSCWVCQQSEPSLGAIYRCKATKIMPNGDSNKINIKFKLLDEEIGFDLGKNVKGDAGYYEI